MLISADQCHLNVKTNPVCGISVGSLVIIVMMIDEITMRKVVNRLLKLRAMSVNVEDVSVPSYNLPRLADVNN